MCTSTVHMAEHRTYAEMVLHGFEVESIRIMASLHTED